MLLIMYRKNGSTLYHSTTHCNTPQHNAAHCNTLQHRGYRVWGYCRWVLLMHLAHTSLANTCIKISLANKSLPPYLLRIHLCQHICARCYVLSVCGSMCWSVCGSACWCVCGFMCWCVWGSVCWFVWSWWGEESFTHVYGQKYAPVYTYKSLLQNIVSFIGLFCKRDL